VVPLPSLIAARTDAELVGRESELARLEAAWDQALEGRVGIALVSGEPGIGKTRLVSEFARARHADGAVVLAGRCDEELGVPFEPFAEALGHLAATSPAHELRNQLGASAALLARIVPNVSEQLPDIEEVPRPDPEVERAEFVDAVIRWLAGVGVSTPVVLILDDLHWADSPSLSLLRALARDRRSARILVLATYREIELSRTHPLADVLADLRREPTVTRCALGGLHEAEVDTLLRVVGDDQLPADEQLAGALADATDGNPFFLLEMIRHLNENAWSVRTKPVPGADQAAARFSLPEGVREVIGKRLSRLSEAANELLQVAAVIGRSFDLALLAEVTDQDDVIVLPLLAEAIRARLVAEVSGVIDRFEFTHALIQETLRTEVPTSLRVRLHRRIAQGIERLAGSRLDERLGALAFHYGEAASSGCLDEAVTYARRAAQHATQSLAFEDAVVYLERALAIAPLREDPDAVEQATLQLALAHAYFSLRDEERSREAAQASVGAARAAGGVASADLAQAAILLWLLRTFSGSLDAAIGELPLVREALEVIPDEFVATRIELLDVLAFASTVESDASRKTHVGYAAESLALARMTGDSRLLADSLCVRASLLHGPDTIAEFRETVAELSALDISDYRGPVLGWGGSFALRARSALRDGDIAAFRTIIEETRAAARRSANPEIGYYPLAWEALGYRLEGRWSESEARSIDAVNALAGFDQTFALQNHFIQLVPIKSAQGRLDELEPLLAAYVEDNPSIVAYRCGLANLHARLGRTAEATANVARIVDEDLDTIARDTDLWLVALSQVADACAIAADVPRAEVLYERMVNVTNINVVVSFSGCDGSFDRVLGRLAGLLGRWDDAETHFATGRALEQRLESPPLVARTDLHHAEMLLRAGRTGDATRAARLITEAQAIATRLDLHDIRHDIEQLRH
jgi:tetratricopeptide (TPR) repeat protein